MRPVLAFRSSVQLETLPLILAVLVGLAGFALVVDAFLGDRSNAPATERRRRIRAERHRVGEALVGLGVLAAAAGLAGRDSWAYSTLTMMGGVVLLVLGAGLNYRLLGESLFHHGPSRRQTEVEHGHSAPPNASAASDEAQGRITNVARNGGGERGSFPRSGENAEGVRTADKTPDTVETDRAAIAAEADRSPPLRIR